MTATGPQNLEDVLDEMLLRFGGPTREAITFSARLHPQHRAAILEFAAHWSVEQRLAPPVRVCDREEAIGRAARGIFSGVLASKKRSDRAGTSPSSTPAQPNSIP